MSYSSLQNKLCGVSDFTLPQAMAIKRLLNFSAPLEDIFERCDAPEGAAAEREVPCDALSC